MKNINGHLIPKTAEQFMYRYLFEKDYAGFGDILPYFWMPKFVNASDASARTLEIYNVERGRSD
jgi:asparagine synthase (glutamine-hydrolysing)